MSQQRAREREESRENEMWYCPHCPIWVGSRLDECKRGHEPPRWELRTEDVPFSRADEVCYSPLWKRLWWKLKGRVRQFADDHAR